MPVMSAVERSFCRSGPWGAIARRVILPWALQGVRPHGHLLELGGGSGAMAEGIAKTFPGVPITMVDLDPAMVKAARARLSGEGRVAVSVGDVTDLPFEDATFEVVVSFLMLHHVIDWREALHEATRVLRPGGAIVGYDLAKTRLAELIHVVDRSPHELIRRRELREALERAGLVDVQVRSALGGQCFRFTARKADKSEALPLRT